MHAWSGEASHAGFTLDWFDGGHFFIRQQEAQVLAALVRHLSGVEAGAEVHAPRALA